MKDVTEADLMDAFADGERGKRQPVIDEIIARNLEGMVHMLYPLLDRDDLRQAQAR